MIIMKYVIKLTDGSTIIGDEVVGHDVILSVIKIHKPKWYEFWKKQTTNDMYTIKYSDLAYVNMIDLTDQELLEQLENVKVVVEDTETDNVDVDEVEIDDGAVDPEESPNDVYNFPTPISGVMYG